MKKRARRTRTSRFALPTAIQSRQSPTKKWKKSIRGLRKKSNRTCKYTKAFLEKYGESESTSWNDLAKDRIAKHKKSGLALRGARYREKISQKDLAKRSGVSQENISKMENGHRPIGEKIAKKLAKALKIDFKLLVEND
jgi:ribosome-binding protein aMBF1 (putative translation factor)